MDNYCPYPDTYYVRKSASCECFVQRYTFWSKSLIYPSGFYTTPNKFMFNVHKIEHKQDAVNK